MPSTYSDLKVELIATGEQSGTWGDTTNTNLGTALEEAIVGRANANFPTDADLTITLTNTNATQVARHYILNVTSSVSLSTTRNLIVPTIDKPYIVENNTTGGQSIVVKTSAGTGVTVPNGKTMMVYADSTNVVPAFDNLPTGTTIGGSTVGNVSGPASSTDNAVARFDGTTGKIVQNSAVTIADDGTTVISTNSSTNALRITQTGSGNALVVEDSANPDSTPFVVDATGTIIQGNTSPISNVQWFSTTYVTPSIQGLATGAGHYSFGSYVNSASSTTSLYLLKSRGATVGTNTAVQSGDVIGEFAFAGNDGTNFIRAAQISAAVDGTPGTNDMPGRLVFSTTADGASSPTERMRINNAGQIGFNSTNLGGASGQYRFAGSITGAVSSQGLIYTPTIQSDVTTAAAIFLSQPATVAASFTLNTLNHFQVFQSTFGAGSVVTNQYGFHATSSLTGATNNFGFYSNIASGTGRWNFYANGTAANYFAGNTGIGQTSPAAKLDVNGNQASNIVAVAALDIDCSQGNFFTKTIAANSTFTFSNAPASRAYGFLLELTYTSGTITWPASVYWPDNTAPTLTAGKVNMFSFITDDGGTTWRGASQVNYNA